MFGGPISAPEGGGAEAALIRAARAYEDGELAGAAALWRTRALPQVEAEWPRPFAAAIGKSIGAVLMQMDGQAAVGASRDAVEAWRRVEKWLRQAPMPLAGGRSTPAHFRKLRRDPETYRAAGRAEELRLCGAAVAVALNNRGTALAARGRFAEAWTAFAEAAALRREAFGWREAGLGAILANRTAAERRLGRDAQEGEAELAEIRRDPVPAGADRFLALTSGRSETRRRLLAGAELVPILRPAFR